MATTAASGSDGGVGGRVGERPPSVAAGRPFRPGCFRSSGRAIDRARHRRAGPSDPLQAPSRQTPSARATRGRARQPAAMTADPITPAAAVRTRDSGSRVTATSARAAPVDEGHGRARPSGRAGRTATLAGQQRQPRRRCNRGRSRAPAPRAGPGRPPAPSAPRRPARGAGRRPRTATMMAARLFGPAEPGVDAGVDHPAAGQRPPAPEPIGQRAPVGAGHRLDPVVQRPQQPAAPRPRAPARGPAAPGTRRPSRPARTPSPPPGSRRRAGARARQPVATGGDRRRTCASTGGGAVTATWRPRPGAGAARAPPAPPPGRPPAPARADARNTVGSAEPQRAAGPAAASGPTTAPGVVHGLVHAEGPARDRPARTTSAIRASRGLERSPLPKRSISRIASTAPALTASARNGRASRGHHVPDHHERLAPAACGPRRNRRPA